MTVDLNAEAVAASMHARELQRRLRLREEELINLEHLVVGLRKAAREAHDVAENAYHAAAVQQAATAGQQGASEGFSLAPPLAALPPLKPHE